MIARGRSCCGDVLYIHTVQAVVFFYSLPHKIEDILFKESHFIIFFGADKGFH